MPAAPIPFGPGQASGNEELAGASPLAVNAVVDQFGAVRRRPGIEAFSTGPAVFDVDGIEGIHVTSTGKIYAVGGGTNRTIWQLNSSGVPSELGTGALSGLSGSKRPVFAETEAMLAIAGGAEIQRVYFAGSDSGRLSADAPTATHVIANSTRLLANNRLVNRGRVNYSGPALGSSTAGHEEWVVGGTSAAGYFEGEARPDPVLALGENTSEVLLFGSTTVQVFAPDATFVYSPVSTREYGLLAPYAVVKTDGFFYWLDHLRRIVRSDGRSFEVVSDPIKRTLDAITNVDDAFAYRVAIGQVEAVCFCFPSDGRTFAFHAGKWSLWMGYGSANNFSLFKASCTAVDPTSGKVYVGTTDGRVGRMSVDALTDAGDPIVVNLTTGYLNRDTDARKHCRVVRLAFRRGETVSAGEPTAFLSWRDDGGPWNEPMQVGLGSAGDFDPVIELRSLGVYRRRAWKLEFSGDEEFALVSATEEYDYLSM